MWTAIPIPEQVHAGEGIAVLPGARLWYIDTGGNGPAVVLLHAASGSGACWDYQLNGPRRGRVSGDRIFAARPRKIGPRYGRGTGRGIG